VGISVNGGWNEKTHEIGVMKAIGARNRDILTIFLLESGIISVIGGILGIFIGAIGVNVISVGLESAFGVEIPAILHAEVLLGGLAVTVIVGVLSGIYPARKAAKMSPLRRSDTNKASSEQCRVLQRRKSKLKSTSPRIPEDIKRNIQNFSTEINDYKALIPL